MGKTFLLNRESITDIYLSCPRHFMIHQPYASVNWSHPSQLVPPYLISVTTKTNMRYGFHPGQLVPHNNTEDATIFKQLICFLILEWSSISFSANIWDAKSGWVSKLQVATKFQVSLCLNCLHINIIFQVLNCLFVWFVCKAFIHTLNTRNIPTIFKLHGFAGFEGFNQVSRCLNCSQSLTFR